MENEPAAHYEIRKATKEDAVAARQLQAKSWLATYPSEEHGVPYEWVKNRVDGWLSPEWLAESKGIFAKVISDPTQFYRLATDGDNVIGFVHALTKDDGTKELAAIYIDPEVFGKGLGQQLIDQANAWIGEADSSLDVASYNARAIRFYEKNGYRVVPGSEHLYRDKIPVVRMEKKGEAV